MHNDLAQMDNILQGDEYDMDVELFELRKQYNEMKKERIQAQKNVNVMENKIKLLEKEEQGVRKTLSREIQNKNSMVKKIAELGSAKEELIKAKMEQQSEMKQKAEKLQTMKESIQHTLKNFHKRVQEKNLNEAMKQKAIKNEILELKREQQNEILEKNKQVSKYVREQEKSFIDKKKQEELEKKRKNREELIKKMKDEVSLRSEMEGKIEKFEKRENELIEKISQTKQGIMNVTSYKYN